ncbi:MAG: PSD1 and planctomycete cytochrome C domain-containing protein [Planctomycetota bacterium]|nr:PSD1 and planctomycete cytochrome C domain-containing protein [Planctomycetota bacterium]
MGKKPSILLTSGLKQKENKDTSTVNRASTLSYAFIFACGLSVLPMTTFSQESKGASSGELQEALGPDHARKMADGLKLFKANVREVLVKSCLPCHGGERTRSKYDLSTRAGLIKGGSEGKAVVIGRHAESPLYRMITHQVKPHMPHKRQKLSAEGIEMIARWIDLGAAYDRPLKAGKEEGETGLTITDEHRNWWAFQPLKTAAPGDVKNTAWASGEIDRFLLSRLEKEGLTPNPEASPRTLVRRAYFGLIGLPPPPEAVDAFAASPTPKAWGALIDELLANKHYGERWGRHWLDLARFAESHGFEQDYDRGHAYHYRDFVIKALNSDMPYNQFVAWQLAGDELAPENPLAMMATGFLGAGVFPTQLTEKEFESSRYDELDDMVNTMGTAMLGLTIGCARCHNHKFDPIPTRDYYRLLSTFGTTIRSEIDLPVDTGENRAALAAWKTAREKALAARDAYARGELEKSFAGWLSKGSAAAPPKAPWEVLDLSKIESKHGSSLRKLEDGSILATGKNPSPEDLYLLGGASTSGGIRALRIEALTHSSMPKNGPGRASNGNFGLTDLKVAIRPLKDPKAKLTPVKIVSARATHQQNTSGLSVKAALDNDKNKTGWAVDRGGIGRDQAAVFGFEKPVGFDGGTYIEVSIQCGANTQHNIGRPRLSIASVDAPVAVGGGLPQALSSGFARLKDGKPEELPAAERAALFKWFSGKDKRWLELNQAVEKQMASQPKGGKTVKVQVTSEGFRPTKHHADGRGFPHFYKETYFLGRGDPAQKQGVASQGFLTVLMKKGTTEKRWQVEPPKGWRTSYRKRSLSNWITDPENGAGTLLARVIVNRLWKHHLGQGLVSTPNDFGVQGEKPTHPELLDWLARELIRGGWRLKPLHKLILLSSAYRQSSAYDRDRAGKDPGNRLLWRRMPARLEAEIIRDSVLEVSGLLDKTMFGKGTLNEAMTRRSIYFSIKRSKVIPSMQLFDSPEPLVSQGSRPNTIIAPQALLFMNSPHIRRNATKFMEKIQAGGGEPPENVNLGYRMTLGRTPTETESAAAGAFVSRQTSSYIKDGRNEQEARRLALADFCQVLFGLNEFIYIE